MLAGLLTGCVERRFIVTTEMPGSPPGALDAGAVVYDEKGIPIGASPVDRQFTYYGKYRFTLVKDGCETLIVEEKVRPPFYEWFGLDFIAENLIPFTIRDVRRFHYVLQFAKVDPPEAVLQRAQELREKGRGIGSPLPAEAGVPGLAPSFVPPANNSNFSPQGQPFMPPARDSNKLPPMPTRPKPSATPTESGPILAPPPQSPATAPPLANPLISPVPPASLAPPRSAPLFPAFPDTPPLSPTSPPPEPNR
jgi:hypothetical protein